MSTFDMLCKKHSYTQLVECDVAIFGSAIRPHLWMDVYSSLKATNKCSFKMFFCGHVRPGFELPEDFTYIHSDMSAAACVEIAYSFAISI